MHLAVACEANLEALRGDDDHWTISSDTYVPLADSDSDNDDECEHLFHWEGHRGVHRERWLAAQEYSQFSLWLVKNQGGQELVDAFCTFLAAKYAVRHYPSPPVAHIWEGVLIIGMICLLPVLLRIPLLLL